MEASVDYLNINAFLAPSAAPQGVYATTRPFTISGPDVWNIDLSLSRNFKVREHDTLTFRAEAFNLTNSVMFGRSDRCAEQCRRSGISRRRFKAARRVTRRQRVSCSLRSNMYFEEMSGES